MYLKTKKDLTKGIIQILSSSYMKGDKYDLEDLFDDVKKEWKKRLVYSIEYEEYKNYEGYGSPRNPSYYCHWSESHHKVHYEQFNSLEDAYFCTKRLEKNNNCKCGILKNGKKGITVRLPWGLVVWVENGYSAIREVNTTTNQMMWDCIAGRNTKKLGIQGGLKRYLKLMEKVTEKNYKEFCGRDLNKDILEYTHSALFRQHWINHCMRNKSFIEYRR